MQKMIRNYLHFYMGCATQRCGPVTPILLHSARNEPPSVANKKYLPVLRHLASMTKDEIGDYNRICTTLYTMADGENMIRQHGEVFKWLVEKGFDVFNLIDTGLAVENTDFPRLY